MSTQDFSSTSQERSQGGFAQGVPASTRVTSSQSGCCGSGAQTNTTGCCGELTSPVPAPTGVSSAQGCCC